jgi:mono/diheme cytochrome c family protein
MKTVYTKALGMKTKNSLRRSGSLILMSIVAWTINGCVWDKTPLVSHGNDGVKDSVCYRNEIQPIINSNCAKGGCHDAATHAAGYDLTSYFNVLDLVKPGKPDKSKLIEVISGQGEEAMPPAPNDPLNQEQVGLIRQWILEGAGLNIDCNISIPCDTLSVSYSGTVEPIIQNSCLGCHSSAGTGGGIMLTSYSTVRQQIDNGRLWGAVNWQQGYVAMPQNGSKLSDCNIAQIGIWIRQGAPNN